MPERSDLEHLLSAYDRVQKNLDVDRGSLFAKIRHGKRPERKAAQILCDELSWSVNERDRFWNGLERYSESLAEYRELEAEVFSNLERLIEQETEVFRRLDIEDERSRGVIAQTYDAFTIVYEYENPSPAALNNLRYRLSHATELICAASKGPLKRTFDKLSGNKGARIFAGSAVSTASVLVAVMGEGGILSWASLKAGYNVMRGDVEGLIDVLKGVVG